jgi:hypothetical protein
VRGAAFNFNDFMIFVVSAEPHLQTASALKLK